MANKFDDDVNVEPLATIVWQDRSTTPVTDLLRVGYTTADPNGVRSGPVGSLLSGPSGTWQNRGGTVWERMVSLTFLQEDGSAVRYQSVQIGFADLVALGAVMTGTFNVGAALPSEAEVLWARAEIAVPVGVAGDAGVVVGVAGDTNRYSDSMGLLAGGRRRNSVLIVEFTDAQQVIATVTADVPFNTLTAGNFVVMFAFTTP